MKILLLILSVSLAHATTYYLAPSGSGGSNCTSGQSIGTPLSTFANAWACLSAGDTLIVADGTYAQNPSPPIGKAGTSGAYITVQAAHDGAAYVTQTLTLRNVSYLAFVGLKIQGGATAIEAISNGVGAVTHHVTIQRVTFNCTDTTSNNNACFSSSDGSHHLLIEENAGWGGGRYTMMFYGGTAGQSNTGADSNTIRRNVLRMGPHTPSSGQPQASLALYYSSSNIVENNIFIDGQANSNDTSFAGIYITDHSPPPTASDNRILGNIVLNNYGDGVYLDCNSPNDSVCRNNELTNNVIWASTERGYVCGGGSGTNASGNSLNHNTIVENSASRYGAELYNCPTFTLKNNIIQHASTGAYAGGSTSFTTNNWNDYWNNGAARSGFSAGANDKTTNPALTYIARIEAAGAMHAQGESGSDIGANVVYRYVDGTLTGTLLWPFPNEARFKSEMCASTPTRGVCNTAGSLTDYVWNYLGNGNPYTGGVAPTITTTSPLPGGTVGVAYSQQLTATGDTPITWDVASGILPPNVSLTTGGLLSGTPSTAGTYTPTVRATNATGTNSQVLSVAIAAAPTTRTVFAGRGTLSGSATIH